MEAARILISGIFILVCVGRAPFALAQDAETEIKGSTLSAQVSNAQSVFESMRKNIRAMYYFNLTGPALDQIADGTSYDVWNQRPSAMDWFHVFRVGYQTGPTTQFALRLAGAHRLKSFEAQAPGYYSPYLGTDEPRFSLNHPWIQWMESGLLSNDRVSLFSIVSVELVTSKYSRDAGNLLNLHFWQAWTFSRPGNPFRYGLTTYFGPRFWSNSGFDRAAFELPKQILEVSFGHFASYDVTDKFTVGTTTQFNPQLLGGGAGWARNSEERVRLSGTYKPLNGLFLAPYAQMSLYRPRLASAVLGLETTFYF